MYLLQNRFNKQKPIAHCAAQKRFAMADAGADTPKVYSMRADLKIAVIGDHFMQPQYFVEALHAALPAQALDIRTLQLPWPDEPMVHGYSAEAAADPELRGLHEYQGEPQAIARFIGDAQVLVNHLAPVSASMLARLPALRLIAVARGGPVNIDMAAARRCAVTVVNAPGRNASAVAECTIGMILAQTRRLTAAHTALSQGQWRGDLYRADVCGDELCAMTVGLIGYGHIGRKVTRLLRPFGCQVLVYDPYAPLHEADRSAGVRQVAELDALLQSCDVVSLHARVTPETTGLLNAAALARMRRGAYLINTARGPLLDYQALHEALASGHLRGAALDTFALEPCSPGDPLLRLPNVTLAPHTAGASRQTVRCAAAMAAEEVRRHAAGLPPLNPC